MLNASCYRNYLTRFRIAFFQNPKQFYNFVNMKRKSANFASIFLRENAVADTDQAMANMFAKFYHDLFTFYYLISIFSPSYLSIPLHIFLPPFISIYSSSYLSIDSRNESSLDLYIVKPIFHKDLAVLTLVYFVSLPIPLVSHCSNFRNCLFSFQAQPDCCKQL